MSKVLTGILITTLLFGGPGSADAKGGGARSSGGARGGANYVNAGGHPVGTSNGFQSAAPTPGITVPFNPSVGAGRAVGTQSGFNAPIPANTGAYGIGVTSNGSMGVVNRNAAGRNRYLYPYFWGYSAVAGGIGNNGNLANGNVNYPTCYTDGAFVSASGGQQSVGPPEPMPMVEFDQPPPPDRYLQQFEEGFNRVSAGQSIAAPMSVPNARLETSSQTARQDINAATDTLSILTKQVHEYGASGRLGTFDVEHFSSELGQLRQLKADITQMPVGTKRDELQMQFEQRLTNLQQDLQSRNSDY